jgi:hypothetical protein
MSFLSTAALPSNPELNLGGEELHHHLSRADGRGVPLHSEGVT